VSKLAIAQSKYIDLPSRGYSMFDVEN